MIARARGLGLSHVALGHDTLACNNWLFHDYDNAAGASPQPSITWHRGTSTTIYQQTILPPADLDMFDSTRLFF